MSTAAFHFSKLAHIGTYKSIFRTESKTHLAIIPLKPAHCNIYVVAICERFADLAAVRVESVEDRNAILINVAGFIQEKQCSKLRLPHAFSDKLSGLTETNLPKFCGPIDSSDPK